MSETSLVSLNSSTLSFPLQGPFVRLEDAPRIDGRPSTGGESVHLRVLPDQSTAIDEWIAKQKEPGLTRPEAIRPLVELGLKAKK